MPDLITSLKGLSEPYKPSNPKKTLKAGLGKPKKTVEPTRHN
jgi:hypothetical protein